MSGRSFPLCCPFKYSLRYPVPPIIRSPPVVLDCDDVYSVFFERKKKLVRKFLYLQVLIFGAICRNRVGDSWIFWMQAASASEKRSAALP